MIFLFVCNKSNLTERYELLKQNKTLVVPIELENTKNISTDYDYIISFTNEEATLLKLNNISPEKIIDNIILHNYNIDKVLEYKEYSKSFPNLSTVSNVCAGAWGYKWLSLPYNGPFTWGYFTLEGYKKTLENLDLFIGDKFESFNISNNVPVGKNADIQYFFNHYAGQDYEKIRARHVKRSAKFNYKNYIIITAIEKVEEIDNLLENVFIGNNHIIITPCVYPHKNVISFPFWKNIVETEIEKKYFYKFYTRYFTTFFDFHKFSFDIAHGEFTFMEKYLTNEYFIQLNTSLNKNIDVKIKREKEYILIESKTPRYTNEDNNSKTITSYNLFASNPALYFLRYDKVKYIDIYYHKVKDEIFNNLDSDLSLCLDQKETSSLIKGRVFTIEEQSTNLKLSKYLIPANIGSDLYEDFDLSYEYIDNKANKCIVIFNALLNVKSKKESIEYLAHYNLTNYKNYNYLFIKDTFKSYSLENNFYFKDILYGKMITKSITKKIDTLLSKIECNEFYSFGTSKGGFASLLYGLQSIKISKIYSVIPTLDIKEYTMQKGISHFNDSVTGEILFDDLIKNNNKEILFISNIFDFPQTNYIMSRKFVEKYENIVMGYSSIGGTHAGIITENYDEIIKIMYDFFENKNLHAENIKFFTKENFQNLLILENHEYLSKVCGFK